MGFVVFLFFVFIIVKFIKQVLSQNKPGQQPPVDAIPVNEDEENVVQTPNKPEEKNPASVDTILFSLQEKKAKDAEKKPTLAKTIITPKPVIEKPKIVVETPKPVAPVKPVETMDLKQEVDDFSRMQRERNEEFERMLKEKNDQFFRSRKNRSKHQASADNVGHQDHNAADDYGLGGVASDLERSALYCISEVSGDGSDDETEDHRLLDGVVGMLSIDACLNAINVVVDRRRTCDPCQDAATPEA